MGYGIYYVLFLICVAVVFILLVDFARNRAEQREGFFRRKKDEKKAS